ncbi:MAG TPA: hypothetical protein VFX25_19120 [Streptosporangiaceae bacterium]|nr:hypothetical protein [Streptosporangiaceae bacterium]
MTGAAQNALTALDRAQSALDDAYAAGDAPGLRGALDAVQDALDDAYRAVRALADGGAS